MPDAISPPPSLLILCRDLLLGSKITAAAQSAGVSFKVIRDAGKLAGQVGRRLIVDLNQDGAIDAAAAWKSETGDAGDVVGFVSHVDAATIQRAREAGLDLVMARSSFVQQLPGLMRSR